MPCAMSFLSGLALRHGEGERREASPQRIEHIRVFGLGREERSIKLTTPQRIEDIRVFGLHVPVLIVPVEGV